MKRKSILLSAVGLGLLILCSAPQASATLTRFIQIVKNDDGDTRFHLAEVEAFEDGVTPNEDGAEFDGKATSTNDIGDGELTTYGDGELFPDIGTTASLEHGGANKDPNNALETGAGVWSTANGLAESAQYTLDLGAEYDITTLRLWPRADGCCSTRWMNLEINLYGDDGGKPGKLNATATHTEDQGNVSLEFTLPVAVNSLTQGLIGYWSFNDLKAGSTEALDASANGNVGTVNGDPEIVAGASGLDGDVAINFDGSDDSVTTEGNIMNDIGDYTMSGWVKFDEQGGNRIGLFGQNDAVEFGMINPSTMQHWTAAGGSFDVPFGPVIAEWTNIIVVATPEQRILYVDGEEAAVGGGVQQTNSAFNFNIGGDGVYDASGNFFTGQMDDIAVWDRPLTADEAKKVFETRAIISPDFIDTDGDGMPDGYEGDNGLDPFSAADKDADKDGDGLSNFAEFEARTNPNDKDTDKDGLQDNVETNTGTWASATSTGTNPTKADSDKDGLSDGVETNTGTFVNSTNTGTNPNLEDSDVDGFADLREIELGTDPTKAASFPMPPAGDLIAYWDFNDASNPDTAVDNVSGIEGAVSATYTEDGGGRTGSNGDYAMNFAEGGFVEVTEVIFMDAVGVTDQMTVSLWQKNQAPPASSSFWIRAVGFNRAAQAHIPWDNGTVYFDTGGGCCTAGAQRLEFVPNAQEGLEDFDFLDDEWHHYAFVKDQGLKQVWIDGILAFETEGALPMPEGDYTDLFIGAEPPGNNIPQAVIDDFAIYAVALPEEDILGLANGNTPGGGGALPFQITAVEQKSDGTVDVTWQSKPGKTYAIEYATVIPEWTEGADGVEAGDGDTTTFTDENVPAGTKERYYRVREE
ncbi:MAG: hypothetical protein O3C21_01545 [Verrucomicrobia bacterium]|nr:hypothetical protein [Verrucomicrobiota bacterium]